MYLFFLNTMSRSFEHTLTRQTTEAVACFGLKIERFSRCRSNSLTTKGVLSLQWHELEWDMWIRSSSRSMALPQPLTSQAKCGDQPSGWLRHEDRNPERQREISIQVGSIKTAGLF
jgi:hypothetical protein